MSQMLDVSIADCRRMNRTGDRRDSSNLSAKCGCGGRCARLGTLYATRNGRSSRRMKPIIWNDLSHTTKPAIPCCGPSAASCGLRWRSCCRYAVAFAKFANSPHADFATAIHRRRPAECRSNCRNCHERSRCVFSLPTIRASCAAPTRPAGSRTATRPRRANPSAGQRHQLRSKMRDLIEYDGWRE